MYLSSGVTRRWLWLGFGLGLSYAASLICVVLDPYWEDNGVIEFIPWNERWGWAAFFTPMMLIVIGPVLYGMRALCKARRGHEISRDGNGPFP
jgi:hypothetical protein